MIKKPFLSIPETSTVYDDSKVLGIVNGQNCLIYLSTIRDFLEFPYIYQETGSDFYYVFNDDFLAAAS